MPENTTDKTEVSKSDLEDKDKKKPMINRFSQFIVFFCMLYGLALTTVSYVFSALGYEPLVDLSSVIVQTIVAPCTVWLCQNAILNIFEKNKLAFSTPIARLEQEDAMNAINEMMAMPEVTTNTNEENTEEINNGLPG